MPEARAVLRKVRCRAASKRTGVRCKRYCLPGHVVCKWHGGGSARAQRAAEVRETLAEISAAWPSLPPREIVATALRTAYMVFQDQVAEVPGDRALTAEERESLWLASGRIGAIAEQAQRLGVSLDGDVAEQAARERGEVIAEALGRVASELVSAAGGTGADQVAVREWVYPAVAAALRGEGLSACPRPWRSTDLLAIESGVVFRERERSRASAALSGSVSDRGASDKKTGVDGLNGAHSGSQGRTGGRVGVVPSWAPVGVRDAVASSGSSLLRKVSDHA